MKLGVQSRFRAEGVVRRLPPTSPSICGRSGMSSTIIDTSRPQALHSDILWPSSPSSTLATTWSGLVGTRVTATATRVWQSSYERFGHVTELHVPTYIRSYTTFHGKQSGLVDRDIRHAILPTVRPSRPKRDTRPRGLRPPPGGQRGEQTGAGDTLCCWGCCLISTSTSPMRKPKANTLLPSIQHDHYLRGAGSDALACTLASARVETAPRPRGRTAAARRCCAARARSAVPGRPPPHTHHTRPPLRLLTSRSFIFGSTSLGFARM